MNYGQLENREFSFLVLPRMRYGCNTLLFNLRSITCQVVAYGRLKTKENFKRLALKVDRGPNTVILVF